MLKFCGKIGGWKQDAQGREALLRTSLLPRDQEPLGQWRIDGGVGGFNPLEIPKALQNRAKLNLIVKTL